TLYDGFLVEYYDGSQWVRPSPCGGWDRNAVLITGCAGGYLYDKPAFGLPSGTWVTKSFEIPLVAGISDFRFRFVHSSDYGTQHAGAYIDDVRLAVP
ncbi:MAG: hypothetical protein ACOC1F_08255, partial [Myxococcota bacterium]